MYTYNNIYIRAREFPVTGEVQSPGKAGIYRRTQLAQQAARRHGNPATRKPTIPF